MRILITGGNGMLGYDLQQALQPSAELFPLGHAECDITNYPVLERTLSSIAPQLVINCAAYTDVDGCERSPALAMEVNARGAGNVARAAAQIGAHVYHISTDYVFDGRQHAGMAQVRDHTANVPAGYVETDATNPLSVYGRSKLDGENGVLASSEMHLVIRTSWLYGAHRNNFVDRVVEQALRGDPVKAVTDQVSCLTWTRDLARGIATLCSRENLRRRGGILHLAGSGMSTRFENAEYIVNWLQLNKRLRSPVELVGTTWTSLNLPAQRPPFSAMVSCRLAEFRLEALPDWRASLNEYLSQHAKL